LKSLFYIYKICLTIAIQKEELLINPYSGYDEICSDKYYLPGDYIRETNG